MHTPTTQPTPLRRLLDNPGGTVTATFAQLCDAMRRAMGADVPAICQGVWNVLRHEAAQALTPPAPATNQELHHAELLIGAARPSLVTAVYALDAQGTVHVEAVVLPGVGRLDYPWFSEQALAFFASQITPPAAGARA
jgi:hypothetical protein